MQLDLFQLHILGGRVRAFAIHGEDDAVVATFQDLAGDDELQAGELLGREVPDERAGRDRRRLRIWGKDAWIFLLRIDDVLL